MDNILIIKKISIFYVFMLLPILIMGQQKTINFNYSIDGNLVKKNIKYSPLTNINENTISDSDSLSFFNLHLSKEATIGPNPSSNYTTIFIKNYVPNTEISYEIVNTNGEKVLNGQFSDPKFEINISKLNLGIYYLILTYLDKKINQIIVKQ